MSISIDSLAIQFQQKTILQDINLQCEPHQLLAICGPNGAGKSTLLKAISSDIAIRKGGILINGDDIRALSPKQLAKKRAMMPQQVEISFNFSACEIIEAGLYLTDDKKARQNIIEKVSVLLDLDTLLQQSYFQLSGGQKQRVQLARVIAQIFQTDATEPRYLLLDECSSAMDIAMVHQVFSLLKQLTANKPLNVGVVAVVHDLNIASLYADKLALISDTRCIHQGTPNTILTAPIINEVFAAEVHVLPHPENSQPMVMPCAPKLAG